MKQELLVALPVSCSRRRIEMPNTFGTFVGIDDVDIVALGRRLIWALRLAHIAVNAFIGNHLG